MRLLFVGWGVVFWIFCNTAQSQIFSFPYVEHFDTVTVPYLPQDWTASGFASDSGATKSGSICILTKGNFATKQIATPILSFSNRFPDKLIFFERRSSTALAYRLEVRASVDGINFATLLASFDTATSGTSYVQRVVSLRGFGLENQSNMKIRWQLLGDSTNNTGTLRIDDVTVTALVSYDLTPIRLSVLPSLPNSKDSLILSAIIKNIGNQTVTDYAVDFSCDLNSDAILESIERFASVIGSPVSPGDSVTIFGGHAPMGPGDYKFFVITSLPGDEQPSNDTTSTLVSIGQPKGSILINEIMYAPAGDEPVCKQARQWKQRISTWKSCC